MKKKHLLFDLSLDEYYKLKKLMDELGLSKQEFVGYLTNDTEELKKLLRRNMEDKE